MKPATTKDFLDLSKKLRLLADRLEKAEFVEGDHPRAKDGKFTSKGDSKDAGSGSDAGPKSGTDASTSNPQTYDLPKNASHYLREESVPYSHYEKYKKAMEFTSPEGQYVLNKHKMTAKEVREAVKKAREVAEKLPQTIDKHLVNPDTSDPGYQKTAEVTPERQKIYDKFIQKELDKVEPVPFGESPRLLLTGGLPGSGKSSIKKAHFKDILDNSVNIDADEVREFLAREDGLDKAGAHASSYQAETDRVVDALFIKAIGDNKNVIYDSTMRGSKRLVKFIEVMHSNGGKVSMVFSEIPIEKSITRAVDRFLDPHSGRFVDPEYIITHGDKNLKTFDLLKDKVDEWKHFDNDVPYGSKPILKGSGGNG